MRVAIITGASSGMGMEITRRLDTIFTDGIDEFWLIARNKERLSILSDSLKHSSYIVPMDLTSDKNLMKFHKKIKAVSPTVVMLVNASGFGMLGKFDNSLYNEQIDMIKVNCQALTGLTRIVLPYMARGSRIINFASSAAFVPQPGFAVYAATKAYVLSFSKALNAELKNRKISVTAVCPGPVNTGFFNVAERHGKSMKIKKLFMAECQPVVQKALVDAYHRKSVSVYGFFMNGFWILTKILPHDILLRIMNLF